MESVSLPMKKSYMSDESAQTSSMYGMLLMIRQCVNKKKFFAIPILGYNDGMKVNPAGNIYCTAPKGVWVISPAGVCLDTILMPVTPSNCAMGRCFNQETLYI